jgi:hypothetical protein
MNTSLEPENAQRVFLHNCQFMDANPHAVDRTQAEKLWALSLELTGKEAKL